MTFPAICRNLSQQGKELGPVRSCGALGQKPQSYHGVCIQKATIPRWIPNQIQSASPILALVHCANCSAGCAQIIRLVARDLYVWWCSPWNQNSGDSTSGGMSSSSDSWNSTEPKTCGEAWKQQIYCFFKKSLVLKLRQHVEPFPTKLLAQVQHYHCIPTMKRNKTG